MENLCLEGFKVILEKYVDPMLKKVGEISRNEWEKIKIDFDISFTDYLKRSYDKYSKIKTILYRTEPRYIYDFFEVPYLAKEHENGFRADDVNIILDISNFIIIQGTGGIGKSTLMKHLFINELEKKDLIPIFLELKEINDMDDNYEITDIICNRLNNLGCDLHKKYLDYALKSGCFLFLLDGYDEIITSKKDVFFRKLDAFCDRFSGNYYVISSRPYSEFIEFQRFTVLSAKALNKEQALSLVGKLVFDEEIKKQFIDDLATKLYDKHKSFASNPLLLNIMLLTYDNYAEIPEKLHLFYENAFETLYSKHDATKSGYRRELRSSLSYDSFKKVFSYFCFVTYVQGKTEFSYDDLVTVLKKFSINKVNFEIEDYIFDLVNSLCVLYKEGLSYKFAHRSFQEYFVALFFKELSDESMEQMGKEVIYKDIFRATHDNVFNMLYDMAEDRFEKNILLPIVKEYEKDCASDKYSFYFLRLVKEIKFDFFSDERDSEIGLWLAVDFKNDSLDFIYRCVYHYVDRSEERKNHMQCATEKAYEYISISSNYKSGDEIECEEIFQDNTLYELIKDTWLGEHVSIMSSLSERLEERQEKIEMDLTSLLL